MTVADPILAKPSGRIVFGGLPNKIFASPNFQRFISKIPILRRVARQEGEALFDLVMGFVQSQALYALVKLNILEHLLDGPLSLEALADRARVPIARMEILLQAGVALKLLRRQRQRILIQAKRNVLTTALGFLHLSHKFVVSFGRLPAIRPAQDGILKC